MRLARCHGWRTCQPHSSPRNEGSRKLALVPLFRAGVRFLYPEHIPDTACRLLLAEQEMPHAGQLYPAVSQLIQALRPGGMLVLLDIMFASPSALIEAEGLSDAGDPSETYLVVGDPDGQLREAGLTELQWWQTAPMHWLVIGHRGIARNTAHDVPGSAQN